MKTGRLRHLCTIQMPSQTKDAAGGITKTWTEITKAWCDIRPVTGSEKYMSHQKYATATHEVFTRWIDGINPKMQLVARGRVFEIIAVLNINERDRMMKIIAKEVLDD